MTVQEYITAVAATDNYVHNSIMLKSSDSNGCVYKWLETMAIGKEIKSFRKEVFIELNPAETGELLSKTVVNSIEVLPAE